MAVNRAESDAGTADKKAGQSAGRLYVLATPIGNLGDISQRAASLLCSVPLIAAEDTRRTARLLRHIGSDAPMRSYHEHSTAERRAELLAHLLAGEDLALVSDAGTPLISDPGYRLVTQAIAAGVEILAIPGPSAVIAALSIAGLPTDRFVFEGFAPNGQRAAWLQQLSQERRTVVLYETPARLPQLLAELQGAIGAERRAVVVLEMTKAHERVVRGTLGELATGGGPDAALSPAKGEAVVLMEGAQGAKTPVQGDELLLCLLDLCSPSEAAKRAAVLTGQPKAELYARARQLRP